MKGGCEWWGAGASGGGSLRAEGSSAPAAPQWVRDAAACGPAGIAPARAARLTVGPPALMQWRKLARLKSSPGGHSRARRMLCCGRRKVRARDRYEPSRAATASLARAAAPRTYSTYSTNVRRPRRPATGAERTRGSLRAPGDRDPSVWPFAWTRPWALWIGSLHATVTAGTRSCPVTWQLAIGSTERIVSGLSGIF